MARNARNKKAVSSRVQVKTMMGKTMEFKLSRRSLLLELKLKILLETGIFPEDMVLLFHDIELNDDEKTLQEYGIGIGEEMDTILLMIKTRSGLVGWTHWDIR